MLLEAWRKNNEANYLLLAGIPPQSMSNQYTKNTRTVAAQFAHQHNVRVFHLQRRAPYHLGKLKTFPRGAQPTKTELKKALEASEKAVGHMLVEFEQAGKVKSWQGSPTTYLGYFISHESHHRGLIMVCLRFGGTKLPQKVSYGIWDSWRKKAK